MNSRLESSFPLPATLHARTTHSRTHTHTRAQINVLHARYLPNTRETRENRFPDGWNPMSLFILSSPRNNAVTSPRNSRGRKPVPNVQGQTGTRFPPVRYFSIPYTWFCRTCRWTRLESWKWTTTERWKVRRRHGRTRQALRSQSSTTHTHTGIRKENNKKLKTDGCRCTRDKIKFKRNSTREKTLFL